MLKPECPWCGCSRSAVYRSRQYTPEAEVYRRRRQCAECGKTWPTGEALHVDEFEKEVAAVGRTLAEFGVKSKLQKAIELLAGAGLVDRLTVERALASKSTRPVTRSDTES